MNTVTDTLSTEKRLLLARSSLNRLRLRGHLAELRLRLPLHRAAPAALSVPGWHRAAFAIALVVAGRGRTARAVAMAGRLFLVFRVYRAALAFARAMRGSAACVTVQTANACPPTLELPTRSTP